MSEPSIENNAELETEAQAPSAYEPDAGEHELALGVAVTAALAADAKKASDIVALDLAGISDVCEAIVVCTGANARLVDSVIDEVEEQVRADCGLSPLSIEGRQDGRWVLIDYGCAIVHVFTPEPRDFYRLERLYGDAPRIDLPLVD